MCVVFTTSNSRKSAVDRPWTANRPWTGRTMPRYLASSISFTDQTDVGLLTINLFKKESGERDGGMNLESGVVRSGRGSKSS